MVVGLPTSTLVNGVGLIDRIGARVEPEVGVVLCYLIGGQSHALT